LLTGAPKKYLDFNGSPHQKLARAGGFDESKVLGGMVRSRAGKVYFDESSGHYGDRWTPELRAQFERFMDRLGIPGVKEDSWI
jgi:hypothetical protein